MLYFSNLGPDETMAINMNDKGVQLTNMTYNEAMIFLPQFDELKYKVKEIYTLPTKISRFTIPPLIQNISFEKKLKIIDTHEIDEDGVEIIKTLKLPILTNARLLSTLMIFDDIGSNTDIQRYTSELSRTITHLVSDSRHAKNTLFFVAQRPSYLFKTARILCHVIVIGQGISDNDLKQVYEENHINTLTEQELMIIYNTLNKHMNHTPEHKNHQSIGTALVHTIGLLEVQVINITALRAIVNVAPVNYVLASSLNIENSVQVDVDVVLGLECVTYIDIQPLPLYVVTYPQANDSYIP
ncbi:MAG: hypothetical protein EZS28_042081, partial [Streblomastix strix]